MSNRTHLLVERLRRGDKMALSDLYKATSSKAYGIILALIGNEETAAQALRELYLTIWKDPQALLGDTVDPARHVLILARRRAVDMIALNPSLRRQGGRAHGNTNHAGHAAEEMLQAAYIDGARLEDLAQRYNLTPQEAQTKLWTDIVDMKGGQA